ncbi:SPASM domain-containing protein, partial [Anaerovibrio sp.]|uniref:radical SAM/SPASM domain-containing protein n=1 Tax=Anaerovibrio sp. TaxID=1872532 RepID=UPI0025B97C96
FWGHFTQKIRSYFGISKEEAQEKGIESSDNKAVSKQDLMLEMYEQVMDEKNIYLLVKITAPPEIEFSDEIGFDYFTVKPFSPHPSSKSKVNVDYSEASDIGIELKQYETEKFKIYFRAQSMENLVMEKSYTACEGVNFMAHMDAEGNVFPCVVYVGQDKFNYGNIYEKDFASIWESERARKISAGFNDAFIHKFCRKACRLDEMNKYLHELKYPGAHVNFI